MTSLYLWKFHSLLFSYYTRKPVAPPPLFSKPVTPPPPPPPSNTPLEEACSAYSKTLSTLLSLISLNEVSTKVQCYIHTMVIWIKYYYVD